MERKKTPNPLRLLLFILLATGIAACKSSNPITAENQSLSLNENTPKSIVLSASTKNGGDLSYEISKPPSFGSLSGVPPQLTYTPSSGYIGPDEFQFTASTGSTKSKPATILLLVTPNKATLSQKPSPVSIRTAQSYSPTELFLEWGESQDDTTPINNIQYEIHISKEENFFPSDESLSMTLQGTTEALIPGMTPGERLYINVIAIDMEGNRSLETKAASLKMAWEIVDIKDDIDLYLTTDQLANPVYDTETGTISFDVIGNELPSAGDYMIIDPTDEAQIVYIEEIVAGNNDLAANMSIASASSPTFQVKARPADLFEVLTGGDINITTADNEGSAGWRFAEELGNELREDLEIWKDFDPETGSFGNVPFQFTNNFACIDENLENPRIDLYEAFQSYFTHFTGGVEIGCNVSIELNSNYGYLIPPPFSDEPTILKGGRIRTSGKLSAKLFANLGLEVPISTPSKPIWSGTPRERKTAIKLGIRALEQRGLKELPIRLTFTPTLNIKAGASAGAAVDIVTNDVVSFEFDETVEFTHEPLSPPFYEFKRLTPEKYFEPKFTTKQLLAKASAETEFETHIDLLLGLRVHFFGFSRFAITNGINSRFTAKGKARAREHYSLLSQHFDNVTPYEMQYMSLRYAPSLKSTWAVNVSDLEIFRDLSWWKKLAVDAASTALLTGTIAEAPLTLDSFILLNTPHYELTSENENGQYTFTANLVEDTGTFVGILKDHAKWHELTSNDEFTLEPVENSDPPEATGRFASNSSRNATVAFEYLPELAKPLLDNDPELTAELPADTRNAFLAGARKFAITSALLSTPRSVDVWCGYEAGSPELSWIVRGQSFITLHDGQLWTSIIGYISHRNSTTEFILDYDNFPGFGRYLNGTQPDIFPGTPFPTPAYEAFLSAQGTNNAIAYNLVHTRLDGTYPTPWPIGNSLLVYSEPEVYSFATELPLQCSGIPDNMTTLNYLLSLPFDDACNKLRACVQEDMQRVIFEE